MADVVALLASKGQRTSVPLMIGVCVRAWLVRRSGAGRIMQAALVKAGLNEQATVTPTLALRALLFIMLGTLAASKMLELLFIPCLQGTRRRRQEDREEKGGDWGAATGLQAPSCDKRGRQRGARWRRNWVLDGGPSRFRAYALYFKFVGVSPPRLRRPIFVDFVAR